MLPYSTAEVFTDILKQTTLDEADTTLAELFTTTDRNVGSTDDMSNMTTAEPVTIPIPDPFPPTCQTDGVCVSCRKNITLLSEFNRTVFTGKSTF